MAYLIFVACFLKRIELSINSENKEHGYANLILPRWLEPET